MKTLRNGFFLLIYLVCISAMNLFAQSNTPIIGYDRVAWGSSVQTVTQTYSGLRERSSENSSLGVREYLQTNVGGGISERIFYFYQNKLYRVFVGYNDIDSDMAVALIERIASIYGPFDDYDESSQVVGSGMGKKYTLIRNYNRNLTININTADFFNQYNVFIESRVGIVYIDLTIQNQIDEVQRRERANKLQL